MSRMIPQRTVNTLRQYTNLAVDLYGIDCFLYVNSNPNTVANLDEYATPADMTFRRYSTKVWIDWSPNKHQLRKMGIFVEDQTPMICYFSNKIADENSNTADIDIIIGSYFKIDMQYIPLKQIDSDEFELIDVIIPSAHDAVITKYFEFAPRRVKE